MADMSGLRVDSLTVDLKGCRILDGVQLDAPSAQITALLGVNGAGKSTVIKAIAGILPSEGTISFNGVELRSLAPRQRALLLGYVPQRSELRAPLPVSEVVAQGCYAAVGESWRRGGWISIRVMRALETVEAVHLAERPFTALSGGEQQLVLLARALVGEAPLLLLDEPSAGLDLCHQAKSDSLLRQLARDGHTVLGVFHDLGHALSLADRVVVLANGRSRAQGSPSEVLSSSLVREVWGMTMIPNAAPSFRLPEAK
jgi:iron complex transport system ATP-binding protein